MARRTKCKKKSHKTVKCSSKRVHLVPLPVEIFDVICDSLTHVHGHQRPIYMYDLRLTCREINLKTYDFFAKAAFQSINFQQTSDGLRTLEDITQSPGIAEKIEK